MPQTRDAAERRPLRADARDNRRRLLDAARDVFIEQGPSAPLDEIARRAGTGIATLYRRFPDRRALMREVVLDALQRTAEQARLAAGEEPDPFRALVSYLHRAIDVRTAAVIPTLLGEVSFEDGEMTRARDAASATVQALVDAAHRSGALRPDVTSGDLGMFIVRLSRPLRGIAPEYNDSLSHRHLDLLIDGLRPAHEAATLGGPAMTFDDLRRLPQPDPGDQAAPGNPHPPNGN